MGSAVTLAGFTGAYILLRKGRGRAGNGKGRGEWEREKEGSRGEGRKGRPGKGGGKGCPQAVTLSAAYAPPFLPYS